MDSLVQQFVSNPTRNPITGEVIKIGSSKYKKLTDIYGDVKIKSPKTGYKITVGKGEYKKLIKGGYKESDLLTLSTLPLTKNLLINNDIIYNIMLHSDIKDILNISCTNKTVNMIYNDNEFWHKKITKDYSFVKVQSKNWQKTYKDICNNIYNSIITANNLIEVLLSLKRSIISDYTYDEILIQDGKNNINIKNIYWLPKNLTKQIETEKVIYDKDSPIISFYCHDYSYNNTIFMITIACSVEKDPRIFEYRIRMDKKEIKHFLTKVLYYYPNVHLLDHAKNQFLYKDLICSQITTTEERRLKCWNHVLADN